MVADNRRMTIQKSYESDSVRNMRWKKPTKRNPGGACLARMTSKGQLTVPKRVREFMDLQPGDAVIISMLGPKVTIERCPRHGELERPVLREDLQGLSEAEIQRKLDAEFAEEWRRKHG